MVSNFSKLLKSDNKISSLGPVRGPLDALAQALPQIVILNPTKSVADAEVFDAFYILLPHGIDIQKDVFRFNQQSLIWWRLL